MNLADIDKLPPAMRAQALADQERATAARERIMAQVSRPLPVPVAAFKINPEWKALETSGKPYAEMQKDGSWRSVPAKSPAKPLSVPARGIPKGPKLKHEESRAQQAVIQWFALNAYEWQLDDHLLMAFPLQGKRTARNGARLKSEGMRKGTLDMLLNVPRGDCCSLWIEMKSSTGKLSESQKLMLKRLTAAGSATVVCRSAQEAQAAIRCYLNLPTRK